MAEFSFEGRSVYFQEAGSGPAVLFLHAFPLSSAMWDAQAAALAGRYRVVRFDDPGFGRSAAAAKAPSMESFARTALAILDRLSIRRAAFVGLSMGGYVALALQAMAADRCAALALCDTRAHGDTEDGKKGREATAQAVEAQGAKVLVERMLPNLLSKGAGAPVRAQVERLILATPPAGAAAALRAMAARADHTPRLAKIGCPAVAICGAQDTLTPPADSQAIARGIPGASYVEISDAGHLANLEQPQAFDDALLKFLSSAGLGA